MVTFCICANGEKLYNFTWNTLFIFCNIFSDDDTGINFIWLCFFCFILLLLLVLKGSITVQISSTINIDKDRPIWRYAFNLVRLWFWLAIKSNLQKNIFSCIQYAIGHSRHISSAWSLFLHSVIFSNQFCSSVRPRSPTCRKISYTPPFDVCNCIHIASLCIPVSM